MHGIQGHEESLNGGIVGDATSALRVALHSIHKDLDAAAECVQELIAIVRLAVLIFLKD